MRIEQATMKYLESVSALFDAYLQFYGKPSAPEAARRFIEERLRNGDSYIACAVADGTIAGFAQLYPSFASLSLARCWILYDLFVAPEFRRRGAGHLLLEAAREHGIRTGACGLTLATQIGNRAAQALYESHGWVRDQEFYHYELTLENP